MRSFGHQRIIRNEAGDVDRIIDSPVGAVTREVCGALFGIDKNRKLVVTLERGDVICLRPQRTKRVYRIEVKDLFRRLLMAEANRAHLEKARARKEKIAIRRAQRRQEYAEKRLVRDV